LRRSTLSELVGISRKEEEEDKNRKRRRVMIRRGR
jgi:hypothetical protein